MVLPKSDLRILGLSFDKEGSSIALYDFEKMLIYGILETINYYTPLEFLDYAVPANRVMPRQPGPGEDPHAELRLLCQRFQCTHALYGTMHPNVTDGLRLTSVTLEVKLYDLQRDTHTLNLQYEFNDLENGQGNIALFTPTWHGLQHLQKWIISQIIGATLPQRAMVLWEKVHESQIARNMFQYQKLANAHYLGTENGLSQKMTQLAAIVKDHPHMFLAYVELGYLFKRALNYPQAINMLEQGLNKMNGVNPRQRALTATEIGICYALAGDKEKSCNWWEAALAEDPTFVNPYINLAHVCEESGKIAKAERYFKQASEVAPDDVRIYFNLARLYAKLEQWDNAIAQYEHQLTLEPGNAWVYSDMANCCLQKGDISGAMKYLRKTMELDPEGEAGKCASLILEGLQAAEV